MKAGRQPHLLQEQAGQEQEHCGTEVEAERFDEMAEPPSEAAPSSATQPALRRGESEVEEAEGCDGRVAQAWREWLSALARDPEAALAAAQAYQQLDEAAREQWLSVLENDAESLGVPSVALYAPLLAAESDPLRLRRILQRLATSVDKGTPPGTGATTSRALWGVLADGARLAVLIEPLYLNFVHVLACAYLPGERFLWVRHEPIAHANQLGAERGMLAGTVLEGTRVEPVPVTAVVDELARTIVAHRRGGDPLPEALRPFADLFGLERVAPQGGGTDRSH